MTKKELKAATRPEVIAWVQEGKYSKEELAKLAQQHGIPQMLMWLSSIEAPKPAGQESPSNVEKFEKDPVVVEPNPVQRTIVKKVNRQGRPSDKRKSVKYGRLSARIDERVIKKMKHALIDIDDFLSQDTFIEEALKYYINNKGWQE